MSSTKVYILRGESLSSDLMRRILEEGGVLSDLVHARSVLLKVNLAGGVTAKPESGAVVSATQCRQVIRCLREFSDAVIYIAESDSIGAQCAYEKFRHLGYESLVEPGVELLDLSRDRVTNVDHCNRFPNGLMVSQKLSAADFRVSLGKVKTHSVTILSGVIKNQFGCLATPDKQYFHPYLTDVLLELYKSLPVHLGILDGNPAMEGRGPLQGSPVSLCCRLIGTEPVAVDFVAAMLMGFKPDRIGHLRVCKQFYESVHGKLDIVVEGELPRQHFRFIGREATLLNKLGLAIQRVGQSLAGFGHLVHNQPTTIDVLAQLLRGPLIALLGIDRLRQLRKMVHRNDE